MKNNLNLSIPKPCSAQWSNFTPTSTGGFCTSCSTNVVDFTVMSDDDILKYLKQKTGDTCGRFLADQLKTYSLSKPVRVNPGYILLKAGFFALLVMGTTQENYAKDITNAITSTVVSSNSVYSIRQNVNITPDQIVKGIIKSDEDGSPLAGVSVYLKDSNEGIVSDDKGRFEFPRKLKEGDVLVFSFVGFSTQEYSIPKDLKEIEITLRYDNVIIMGEVSVNQAYDVKQSGFRRLVNKIKGIF